MFILFGLFFLAMYAALVFYIGRSGWGWVKASTRRELSRKFKLLYIIIFTFVVTSFVTGRLFENVILKLIGSFWLAFFYLLVFLLPLMHMTVWALRYTRLQSLHLNKWAGVTTLGLTLVLVAYGLFHAYSPTIQTYDIHIKKNIPVTSNLNIVMASDMHFGLLSGKAHAARLVEQVNELKPDIVLFPGDILDDEIEQFIEQGIDQILTEIVAPYGVYISLGNHDRHHGPIEELIAALEGSNILTSFMMKFFH